MYTVSNTAIMCVPACLQVLKTTLDLLLGTCESQRKGDNSNVDLVTHSEAFLFFFFWNCLHWAVKLKSTCPCEHSGGAGSCSRWTNQDLRQWGENVFTPKYLPSRAQPRPQFDVVDGVVGRGLIQVWAADGLDEGPLLRLACGVPVHVRFVPMFRWLWFTPDNFAFPSFRDSSRTCWTGTDLSICSHALNARLID